MERAKELEGTLAAAGAQHRAARRSSRERLASAHHEPSTPPLRHTPLQTLTCVLVNLPLLCMRAVLVSPVQQHGWEGFCVICCCCDQLERFQVTKAF